MHVLVVRICGFDVQSDERLAAVRLESLVQLMVIHAQAGEDSEEVRGDDDTSMYHLS